MPCELGSPKSPSNVKFKPLNKLHVSPAGMSQTQVIVSPTSICTFALAAITGSELHKTVMEVAQHTEKQRATLRRVRSILPCAISGQEWFAKISPNPLFYKCLFSHKFIVFRAF